ncbi:MAG: hypothetical protein HFJ59_03355 [Clostridia bacterium]|nr:hypothetical protein [Clostridia bacterium]
MENASKALLMVGGVLIGLLIISLAVYLFADFGATSAEINAKNVQKQINAFNSKFTVYQGYTGDITIYDIVSLATYANENNVYYENSPEEQIVVRIGGNQIQGLDEKDYNILIRQYIDDNTGILTTFRCEDGAITYNEKGRVNRITFIEN